MGSNEGGFHALKVIGDQFKFQKLHVVQYI